MKKETHSSSSGRSIAQRSQGEGARKSFSSGAQLTKHASVAPFSSSQPVQRYKEGTVDDVPIRISNDHVLGVMQTGGLRQMGLYVRGNAELAPNVLYLDGEYTSGTKLYGLNVPYMQDCAGFGNRLLDLIHGLTADELPVRGVTNAMGGVKPLPVWDYPSLFNETVARQAAPGVGDAFIVVSNKDDEKVKSGEHFNFHYGTVVAKSGSDVVTAEADSTRPNLMQFQMYSISDVSQSFKQNYVNMNKLKDTAKLFEVKYAKTPKPEEQRKREAENRENPIEL